MRAYEVTGPKEASRVLVVQANQIHRFLFINEKQRVKFLRSGSELVAAVKGVVRVFKKPRLQAYHYEYMKANSKALWFGVEFDPDRVMYNMLEFEEEL